jgi:pyrroline-5-carboxylate reductase
VPPATAVVAIAAGIPIATYADALGRERAIVRVMPNTPAAIGRGVSALVANDATDAATRELATTMMAAVGDAVWLEDEDQMHVVTALSGGGPAYVFWLIESLAAAGVAQGLGPDVALRLARGTVAGAGELARTSGDAPDQLRRNVTSPGGTTAEALAVLMADDGLAPLVDRALRAAAHRSRVLAGEEDPA